MRYVSTRGKVPAVDFEEALLAGLAPDGGLYLPEEWPRFSASDLDALKGLAYPELACKLMAPFLGETIAAESFARLTDDAYAGFDHRAVAPLRQIGAGEWILELYHGPTLSFKDVALQPLARLFDHFLGERDERLTILGATSGDTGSAAIEACRGRTNLELFILHPKGRISEVQRRQMTTVQAENIHNVALEGTFDDCQALVKALFADAAFRAEMRLGAVNSINWARIMAQAVYYFASALALGAREIVFAVPSGNFGDVFAGHVARMMGLPISRLIVATNRNDILARFIASGTYRRDTVEPTISPAMDIQVASNFERLLFELQDRDGAAVAALMEGFGVNGELTLEPERMAPVRALYGAARVDDERTLATIAAIERETGGLIDPHTATGVAALRMAGLDRAIPRVALATAHPAKFPDAVERATGRRPALPDRLADLEEREERVTVLPNDPDDLKRHMREERRARPKERVA